MLQLEAITDSGITTRSGLNYCAHISAVSNKAHSRECIILRRFYSRSLTLRRRVFIVAFIRPWNTPRNSGTHLLTDR